MGKESSITDDHHCTVKERTRINVELAKCDAEFEKGAVRDSCYDSVMEVSKNRVVKCKSQA